MDIYFYREEYKKGKNILYRDFGHFYTKTLALKLWGGATFTLPLEAPEGYSDCYLKLIWRDSMTGKETLIRQAHCKSIAYLKRKEAREHEKATRHAEGMD